MVEKSEVLGAKYNLADDLWHKYFKNIPKYIVEQATDTNISKNILKFLEESEVAGVK